MLNKFWEKVFIVSTIFVVIFINFYFVKFVFWGIYSIGNHFDIRALVSFTKNTGNGLAIVAFLLAVEIFFYIYKRMKKAQQNRQEVSLNDENTIEILEKRIENLANESQQIMAIIRKLKDKKDEQAES